MPNGDREPTSAQLLGVADDLLRASVPGTEGLWPRAVAFLLRLALERTIDEFWDRTRPEMTQTNRFAQLVCLRGFVQPSLAARAHQTWGALSAACHYHEYDLLPTAGELRGWHAETKAIGDALADTTS